MEITCLQMDVLISFYIEGDLSETLKQKVEEHLKECPICRAKYNIISSLFSDFHQPKSKVTANENEVFSTKTHNSEQYKLFKKKLSAYIDNELPDEENIKMKKYTITNKKARKALEDSYHIRRLMQDSFRKTQREAKPNFSKTILRQINMDTDFKFNSIIFVSFAFIMSVILISAIVIYFLNFN